MNRWLSSLALGGGLLMGALLASCGGGTDVAGVGSGGSGLAGGTISGFGSVIVDAVEIDDAQALQVVEQADGRLDPVALKLGQRVAVQRQADGAASRLTVEPAAVGPVSQVEGQSLTVLGQQVAVETAGQQGPVTFFGGGYLRLADVAVGDLVEVHGARDAAGTLRATRIERRTSASHWVLSGPVDSVTGDRGEAVIGALRIQLAGASVTPGLALLEAGVQVRVWAQPAFTADGRLPAVRVRIAPPMLGAVVVGQTVQYAGPIAAYDATSGTLRMDGVRVRLASAVAVEPSKAALANGGYARVEGTWSADGSLLASAIRLQGATGELGQVVLAGTIATLQDGASFVVRGVPVDASGVTAACTGVALAVGTYVEVRAIAQPGTDVVRATALACKPASAAPSDAVRELQGVAGALDAAGRSFLLALSDGSAQRVSWDERTVFLGLQASGLSGTRVIASGGVDSASGVLIARELRVPGQLEADRFDPAAGAGGWTAYDRAFRPDRAPATKPAPAGTASP